MGRQAVYSGPGSMSNRSDAWTARLQLAWCHGDELDGLVADCDNEGLNTSEVDGDGGGRTHSPR